MHDESGGFVDRPLLSIVIPAYNYAATLARAAQSVLAQRNPRIELLIIDDGSTDATPRVIDALHLAHPGRFRSLRKPNGGLASVRNRGITEGRGDWLLFLDADDELCEGAVEALLAHIEAHPESRLVIGGHISVSESGQRRAHQAQAIPGDAKARVRGYLLDKTLGISNGACAMHREVFGRGQYPERFRNVEDIPVFAQVLAYYPVSYLEQPLALIHKHGDSLRHHIGHGQAVGIQLVDEVFDRLPPAMQDLRREFHAQRCLSLFRSAYLAGDHKGARRFFVQALAQDWRVLFRLPYSRKALRAWLWNRR
jgi:glycosyltransferase involved in cell wall biosynthesis